MRGYKTIHTLTKRIKNRTTDNDNNNNNNNNNNNSNSISSNNNNKQLCKWYSTTLDIEIEKKK